MSAVTELYLGQPFWIWAGLAAALLAVEVMTGSGWLLWAAAAAAATGAVVAGLDLNLAYALLLFALLTLFSTLLARRYLPRPSASLDVDINDNLARLVGERAAAVQAFRGGHGRVSVDGKEWAAELEGSDALPIGADVEIVAVEGVRLRVRPA